MSSLEPSNIKFQRCPLIQHRVPFPEPLILDMFVLKQCRQYLADLARVYYSIAYVPSLPGRATRQQIFCNGHVIAVQTE